MRYFFLILSFLISFSAHAGSYGELHPTKVLYVVDGDTIAVNWKGKKESIRLLEVDTFEVRGSNSMNGDIKQFHLSKNKLKSLGKIGSNLTKQLVHRGDTVWLSFEGKRRGYYKRLLAFVHLSNGKVLNEELMKQGVALVYARNRKGSSHHQDYLKYEAQANSEQIGVWSNANVRTYYQDK